MNTVLRFFYGFLTLIPSSLPSEVLGSLRSRREVREDTEGKGNGGILVLRARV